MCTHAQPLMMKKTIQDFIDLNQFQKNNNNCIAVLYLFCDTLVYKMSCEC